ncbi:PQQ-dependent sugar dehydrogenase [Micromonospora echinofusca]|uniref:PQQ-dependent sugar dehydrogenase n=1 Tax=Micromonospora echinofusca TaxID=47858 RepID=UPI001FCAF431|nr:PQQ-dependent sugar dehydrogenase [Micromonospora echinofusca]
MSALLAALVLLLPAAVGGPPGRPPAATASSAGPPAATARSGGQPAAPTLSAGPPVTAALPAGFTDQTVLAGLTQPTKLAFSPDGRIFVAEKAGLVKVFDGPGDPTPVVFADLRPQVYDYTDLGLLGLTLAPSFPADPYVYVSYSYDGVVDGSAPTYHDTCPRLGNCRSSARVSRLRAAGDVTTGAEQVLLHDWCTQSDTHSVGDLHFGPDGALYVTGGDGAAASYTDYGQGGSPANPCGDPPVPAGTAPTPPTAEGGALRSQDLRTPGDPTGLGGTLIRIDPATGAARPDNPLAGSTDRNTRRIVAHGLRNAYRWTFRPGTREVWLGDVGWRNWEEINRLPDPLAGPVPNYGWPCYEGNNRQNGFDAANLDLCESLYRAPAGTVTAPYYTYAHNQVVASGDGCPTGGSSPSGVAFYPRSGGAYPAEYAGALFFADYSRRCVWAMRVGADGLPDPARITGFSATAFAVDLQVGADGDVYYVDLPGGTVRRFHHTAGNQPPVADLRATPVSGPAPLTVTFDASGSTDPDAGDVLGYEWDFTGDGTWDATGVRVAHTYPTVGTYTARLRVTDPGGLSDTAGVQILVGIGAPVPVIDLPDPGLRWRVGQPVTFAGHATDPQDGPLPASALRWRLVNRHCTTDGDCHSHVMQELTGVTGGSFPGPDHEYPSYLELTLTATDSAGLTGSTTLRLDPATVDLAFTTVPSGLRVNVNGTELTTPAAARVIIGATTTLSAPSPQGDCVFADWSDGGAQTHALAAPADGGTWTATFTGTGCGATGYRLTTEVGQPYVGADGPVLPLAGDDVSTRITLPFPVPFHGRDRTTAWVSSNGFLAFVDPGGSQPLNGTLPDPAAPNALVAPFWDDLVVRADSAVRTGWSGAVGQRRFVVEWHNIGLYGSSSARISFSVVFAETGTITFHYADLSTTKPRERGDSATVGLENDPGTGAVVHSVNRAALANGTAITFHPVVS